MTQNAGYTAVIVYDNEDGGVLVAMAGNSAGIRIHVVFVSKASGLTLERSQFDANHYDTKMNELLASDGQEFFASYDEVHDSFDAMGLQENPLRGIYAYGFERPSAIQQRGIVPFCKGLDVIQQVLALTRELAQQIEKVMRALGDFLSVKVHACVGGTSVREDQRIIPAACLL
ncbi:eukaryotic initiation factor 4A-13-like [Cicer arietinum]|uniref:eukaryotic initiation factor 4A-13-like n=1 Tax=Cicer arietinum TaxID=3827 RepID=UPI003CC65314